MARYVIPDSRRVAGSSLETVDSRKDHMLRGLIKNAVAVGLDAGSGKRLAYLLPVRKTGRWSLGTIKWYGSFKA
jgi:hypothetical protein